MFILCWQLFWVTNVIQNQITVHSQPREGDKDEDLESFFLWWSQVVSKEMSFQLLLEDWQGSSGPDGGEDHSTGQERWTRMFWRVILSLSVMVPRGVAH